MEAPPGKTVAAGPVPENKKLTKSASSLNAEFLRNSELLQESQHFRLARIRFEGTKIPDATELASERRPIIVCPTSGAPAGVRDGEMAEWPNARHC